MELEIYLNILEKRYAKFFTIEKNISLFNEQLDMYAKFHDTNGRTLLTQKDVIDFYETNEYCFIKSFKTISFEDILKFSEFLNTANSELVKPHKNHRNSYVTGVILSSYSLSKDVNTYIKNFKYSKSYKLYLHGWSDTRLIAVDLENNSVITNEAAKDVKKVYLPL